MSVEHGPSRLARSACDGCDVLCLDEELDQALECMPDHRHCADCCINIRTVFAADEAEHAEEPVLELPELVEYVDVLLWARPVLARGLTLSVQSWEGRAVGGSILFPGYSVPLSLVEVHTFTRAA